MTILKLLISVIALSVLLVDLRQRQVYLLQIVSLFVVSTALFIYRDGEMFELLYNSVWLIIQFAFLLIYILLVKQTAPEKAFGAGDALFLISIIPLFSTLEFIVYYISGLVFSILVGVFLLRVSALTKQTIPLAGLLGLWLVPFLFIGIDQSWLVKFGIW